MTCSGRQGDVVTVSCDFHVYCPPLVSNNRDAFVPSREINFGLSDQPGLFCDTPRNVISETFIAIKSNCNWSSSWERHTYRKTLISLLSFLKNICNSPSRMMIFGTKKVVIKKTTSAPTLEFPLISKPCWAFRWPNIKEKRNSSGESEHKMNKKQSLGVSD